jgi:hypothetical protein
MSPSDLHDVPGIAAAALALALILPACSQKPAPPTQGAATRATASEPRSSALQWAGDEPTALVRTHGAVLAQGVRSGRSRVLWTGAASWVFLDTTLDLVWVQGAESLDVIDVRAATDEVVAIARGLPSALPISITRTTDGGSHATASPSGCDSGRTLALEWEAPPRLRLLDTRGWTKPEGARLVGAAWLDAQIARPPGAVNVERREFPLDGSPVGPAFSGRGSRCPAAPCGRPIPFDGSGVQLVVTSFDQGDCVHLGCHLYDPAAKKFATPPMARSWGDLDRTPAGPCGVYHFDRTGKRFLVETSLCAVGGACQDLGGDAVGWLSGGVDVGASG